MTKKVVIFAGHDDDTWEELGAKGVRTDLEADGVYEEYDTNILIAAGAVKILRGVPGLTVYFPQENGRDMTLAERTKYANAIGADFLIDVHSNASASRTATGAAAFYWKASADSKRAADIYRDLLKAAGLPLWAGGTYPSEHGNWTNFHMLRESNMPAILLENFFFTTRSDLEDYLLNPAVQRDLMMIVAETAVQYFNLNVTVPDAPQVSPAKPKPAPAAPSQSGTYTGDSVVDYLVSKGMNPGFDNRAKLAKQYGIPNYKGSASQNLLLLGKLRAGKPATTPVLTPTKVDKPKASGYKGDSIVDYLNSVGQNPSFANRAKLAKQYGIANYSGSPSQNLTLLNKLRTGAAKAPAKPAALKVGQTAKIKPIAKTFATGEKIAAHVKGRPYKILQVKSDRVLLDSIRSWVRKSDLQ